MTLTDVIKDAQNKELPEDDYIEAIWESDLPVPEKVDLSLALFDQQPTYHVLTTMWLDYYSSNEVSKSINETIYQKYLTKLTNPNEDLSNSMEYSLYFDIFENPDRNEQAWTYFLNQRPSEHFIKIILANSGPIPYYLKHDLYEKLLPSERFHVDIYKSIRHSCFDNCGQINKQKALLIFQQLKLTDQINQLKSTGFRTCDEVKSCLEASGR